MPNNQCNSRIREVYLLKTKLKTQNRPPVPDLPLLACPEVSKKTLPHPPPPTIQKIRHYKIGNSMLMVFKNKH